MEEQEKNRPEEDSAQSGAERPEAEPNQAPTVIPAADTTPPPDQPVYPPAEEPAPTKSRSLTGPLLLIGVGVIILLNNLGLIGWTLWEILWRFWPVWLIAIGVDMIFGRRNRWGSLLVVALVLTLVGGAFYVIDQWRPTPVAWHSNAVTNLDQPLNGAQAGRIELSSGVSQLTLRGGAGGERLLQGSVLPLPGEQLDQEFRMDGSTAYFKLQSRFPGANLPFNAQAGDGRWELRLNEEIPLDLTLKTGVGQSDIDLSRLQLTNLQVTTGVGETTLTLPASGNLRAWVTTGVGQSTIRIPDGMAARIRVQTGIGGVSVRGDLLREGNYYVTPGYQDAASRIELDVEGGVGGIRIETGR